MSLTHPNAFEWRGNPNPELAGFIQELSNKSKNPTAKKASGFLPADTSFQPPHFRNPKPPKVVRRAKSDIPLPVPKRAVRATSLTGQLRILLAELGPMSRSDIAERTGLDSQKVGELLKQCRHVRLDKSKYPQRYYVASNPPAGVTP